ncbi:hypothetical protein CPC16_011546 [Podila verticillata]|nr:hypothetical protein CPC16_011546 [Podila verticillata]
MALQQQQQQPENNNSHSNDTGYPSPTTPSGLLWSPADLSMPSSSSSSFSSSSSSHFPLFKPRLCDTSSSTGQQGHSHSRHNPNINYNYRSNPEDATAQPHQQQRKPRPSPLALYANPTGGPSSHYRATGSSTSAVSCDTTTAHDIVGSPQSAMATATASAASFGYMGASHPSHSHSHPHHNQHQYAGATSPLSRFHHLSNNNNNNNSNKHGSNHGYHGNHSNHRYSLQGPPPSNPSSLMHHRASSLSLSSASSSSYSTISSPSSSSPCFCHSKGTGHRPGCHKLSSSHLSSAQQHHPACQHHTHFVSISTTTSTAATNTSPPPQQVSFLQPLQQQQQQQQAQYAAKFGRATKGVSRFGTPHFTPEFDPSDASYTASFSRSNRRGVSGENNGYGRPRDFDDDAMDVDDSSYASEPPKKKQRSTASILLGAAVETVIFTGAVALSAYQLLTGMGKLSTSSSANHSKQGSTASDVANAAEPQDNVTPASEAMQEDEKSVKKNTPTPRPRAHYSSGSLGRTARGSYYHKAKTSRSFRARQSLSGTHNFSHAAGFHARSSSMPVRPNTGTEDTDEAFGR